MCPSLDRDAVALSDCAGKAVPDAPKVPIQALDDYVNETVFLFHINCEGCEAPLLTQVLNRGRLPHHIEVQFHPQHVNNAIYCALTHRFAYVWELWSRPLRA
jgi:hypothetical protein